MADHEVNLTSFQKQVQMIAATPDTLISRYASVFALQPVDGNLVLLCYEVHSPVFFGPPEVQVAALEKVEAVNAECVARIIFSAERVPELIQLLTAAVAQHQAHQMAEE